MCVISKKDLTKKYFNTVYRLALSRTRDKSYADDVTQEVFVRFLKTNKNFESEEHIKAWLIKITINCSKDIFLNTWFKKTTSLSEVKEEITFDDDDKTDIYYAVMSLPQKYRTVIHLFYYEDYSISDISKSLNIKESTVKSQLHRAREILKTKLEGGFEFV